MEKTIADHHMPAGDPPTARRALHKLSVVELWERFSYYILTALLPLFLVAPLAQGGAGWTSSEALRFYGWFIAGITIAPFFGGLISDRWLGAVRALFAGAILMMAGHMLLGFAGPGVNGLFFLGLFFVAAGNGLFKPNISVLIGRLPHGSASARDAAFGTFWMFINIGGLLATIGGGLIAERLGWHRAFGTAAGGMALALLLLTLVRASAVTPYVTRPASQSLQRSTPVNWTFLRPILVVLILVIIFGIGYFQIFGALSLFTAASVDRVVLGFEVPTIWFVSLNPVFMLIVMPFVARAWSRGGGIGHDWSTTGKIALGFVLLAVAFLLVTIAVLQARAGLASPFWIVSAVLLLTLAELMTGPIALAAVSRLAPQPVANLAMGGFSAAIGIGGLLSGQIGALAIGDRMLPVSVTITAAATAIAGLLFAVRMPLRRIGI